jgi:hypothetical protein
VGGAEIVSPKVALLTLCGLLALAVASAADRARPADLTTAG